MQNLLNEIKEYIDTLNECVLGYKKIGELDKSLLLKFVVDDLEDIIKDYSLTP